MATELGEEPDAIANASRVSEVLTEMGPEYTAEDVVGVVPLVV